MHLGIALAGIFEVRKAHLAHGWLGSGGQAYFSTFGDLIGKSLRKMSIFDFDLLLFSLKIVSVKGREKDV